MLDVRRMMLALGLLMLMRGAVAFAEEPLRARIDALIEAAAEGKALSPPVDDAGFLRRVSLDLTGAIPTAREARAFLDDTAPEKRTRLVEALLAGPGYPRRMEEFVHVMFMERLGDHPRWARYLRASFAVNKPWDQMACEILRGRSDDEASQGAAFFYAKRLEHYGENPVDYPGLTRDVGRLFLGIDLRCAQCHDHVYIADYKQQDFQGLHTFFQNTMLSDLKNLAIEEKPTTAKTPYTSVFTKVPRETGPRVPGLREMALPVVKQGEEYLTPPDPKKRLPGKLRYSLLEELAKELPADENPAFARNIVNRLWFAMMGRGLVHPLDQFSGENPPSHPAVLELLAREFVAHKYDGKWLLCELAQTRAYQRSDRLPEGCDEENAAPESYRTALEKRLPAESLLRSMLIATGTGAQDQAGAEAEPGKALEAGFEALREKYVKAFANEPREPEDEFNPSLRAALFLQNDAAVLDLLLPHPGNLVERLASQADDDRVADELYLAILTRRPDAAERAEAARYLAGNRARRAVAVGHLAWALLASAEFSVNH